MTYHIEQLLLATGNPGKLTELADLLKGARVNLVSLADMPGISEVEETGTTFEENARIKARGYALQTSMFALADDSGLEIAALNGRPGVLSARYGGAGMSFSDKIARILRELQRTGRAYRRARFVCSMAIADPGGHIVRVAEGICQGNIAIEPQGTGGFGYDPVFIPDGSDRTFGELPEGTKQQISHRARAFDQIIPFLRDNIAV
jgi:XTP/dITP diphosphohydrolase